MHSMEPCRGAEKGAEKEGEKEGENGGENGGEEAAEACRWVSTRWCSARGIVERVLLHSGMVPPCCCSVPFSAVLSGTSSVSSTVDCYSGCLTSSFSTSFGVGGVDCRVA